MFRRFVGFHFGHVVVSDDGTNWRYEDTGESIEPCAKSDRACPECNEHETPEEHDPCIANLPGVEYACCGHGQKDASPYVKMDDGSSTYFDSLKQMKNWIKKFLNY